MAKNRLHMDVRVAGVGPPEDVGPHHQQGHRAAGATIVKEYTGHHIVMADPEGNELCVC